MNSMLFVDQSAACIMMSAGLARALGIPDEQLVYLHGCGDAYESQTTLYRQSLHRSEATRLAGDRAMAQAAVTPEQIDLAPSRTMQLHSIAKPIHTAHTYSYVAYMSYGTGRSIYVLPDSCAGRGAGVWAQLNGWQENDPDWRSDVPLQPMYMHWLTLCASLCLFVYLCASMCYTYSGRCRYNGGPGANTAMHSLAAMVPKLRRAAGSYGASVSLCLSVCLSVSLCVSLCLSVCLGAPGVQRRV